MRKSMKKRLMGLLVIALCLVGSCNLATKPHPQQVSLPVISPPDSTYYNHITVSITCETSGARIYYTLDGSDPDESSNLYSVPFNLSISAIVRARAYKEKWNPSGITQAEYCNANPAGFVYIAGGAYSMGDVKGNGMLDELPYHTVILSPYFIATYEVTQGEWQALMGSNPSAGYGVGNNHPVYLVSWYDVIKYCNLRSISEGLTPVYSILGSSDPVTWGTVPGTNEPNWDAAQLNMDANGYRLPTEAEWEFASREASSGAYYNYSGSDDINSVAWYGENSFLQGTQTVGTKSPNALGLFDMSGNVWEWCWDWYAPYVNETIINPTGPTSGTARVIRGGSWTSGAINCRSTARNAKPIVVSGAIGFRLCRGIGD
mgnify:FL=1